jgi:hypothetical protein
MPLVGGSIPSVPTIFTLFKGITYMPHVQQQDAL